MYIIVKSYHLTDVESSSTTIITCTNLSEVEEKRRLWLEDQLDEEIEQKEYVLDEFDKYINKPHREYRCHKWSCDGFIIYPNEFLSSGISFSIYNKMIDIDTNTITVHNIDCKSELLVREI